MQAVPPDYGAIDDRNVDGPDQSENRCHAAHAPTSACVIDAACIGKRDIAQLTEQQHQHARHAAIPFPPRPPGWTAPDRARHTPNSRKPRPRRGHGAAHYACEWMTPDHLYPAGDPQPGPAAHAKPGDWPPDQTYTDAY